MEFINGIATLKQATAISQFQLGVARKILDQQEMQGAAAIQLIEAAGKVGAGDHLVAAATGLGAEIDVYG